MSAAGPARCHHINGLDGITYSLRPGGTPDEDEPRISARKIWPARDYFLAKRQEQRDRHLKSNHTEYSLEPNVKTSPGGLRDIQTLLWVARRQFDTGSFNDLVDEGILTPDESTEIQANNDLLLHIRFALHTLIGRDENRLLFEYQQQLAARFGYQDGTQLAVEQFMQYYYRIVHSVNTINEILLQHFDEVIVRRTERLSVKPINQRFRLVSNYLEVTTDTVFEKQPSALIEMFVIIGANEQIDGIRAATIRLARRQVERIGDEFRSDPENARLFMALLGSNNHLFTQLRNMARYGILGAYLPEFGRVIGQMQFDLFHIYTVDAHTLQVVRNMRRFRYENQEQQFPIAANIHHHLPKVELLYIAGLYHDIAKGMGGDHSELGVAIARGFCERHKLTAWETDLVCWLVENHLVMSTTIRRKDIQDPQVIHEFAQFVGDQTRLDYLYTLTVADINATNPTLWNGWRASLMQHLYLSTKKALHLGPVYQVDRSEYVKDIQEEAIARLKERHIARQDVLRLWNQVDDEYFVRESVPDIIWHTEAIMAHDPAADLAADLVESPLILIKDDQILQREAGFTRIFIHTRNRKDLFVSIVTAIDKLGLDIVDAGIATSDLDLTFNTFTVLESNGQPVGDNASRIERIRKTIISFLALGDTRPMQTEPTQRKSRQLKPFQLNTEVTIQQDAHGPHTVLEVVTLNRPGLLAAIARVLVMFDINLVTAKITTLGERVEDTFYITSQAGLDTPQVQDSLKARITEALEQHQQEQAREPVRKI